jgi:hypothetical protein
MTPKFGAKYEKKFTKWERVNAAKEDEFNRGNYFIYL